MLSEKTNKQATGAISKALDRKDYGMETDGISQIATAAISAVLNGDEVRRLVAEAKRTLEMPNTYAGLYDALQPFLPAGE